MLRYVCGVLRNCRELVKFKVVVDFKIMGMHSDESQLGILERFVFDLDQEAQSSHLIWDNNDINASKYVKIMHVIMVIIVYFMRSFSQVDETEI